MSALVKSSNERGMFILHGHKPCPGDESFSVRTARAARLPGYRHNEHGSPPRQVVYGKSSPGSISDRARSMYVVQSPRQPAAQVPPLAVGNLGLKRPLAWLPPPFLHPRALASIPSSPRNDLSATCFLP